VTIQKRKHSQQYEDALVVTNIDFVTDHSFNVNIYLFSSSENARPMKIVWLGPLDSFLKTTARDRRCEALHSFPLKRTHRMHTRERRSALSRQPDLPATDLNKVISYALAKSADAANAPTAKAAASPLNTVAGLEISRRSVDSRYITTDLSAS